MGAENETPNPIPTPTPIGYPVSNIPFPVSSIPYPASRIPRPLGPSDPICYFASFTFSVSFGTNSTTSATTPTLAI
jgi:hypothetical protein